MEVRILSPARSSPAPSCACRPLALALSPWPSRPGPLDRRSARLTRGAKRGRAAPGGEALARARRAVLAVEHATRRTVRAERHRLGPRAGRGVRGLRRHQGQLPQGHAGDHPDQPRREVRKDPQDTVDEGRARRRLRRRRLQGRCPPPSRLVLQPGRRSQRRAPGRSDEDRHGRPGGHRGRESRCGGSERSPPTRTTPTTRRKPTAPSPSSCSSRQADRLGPDGGHSALVCFAVFRARAGLAALPDFTASASAGFWTTSARR